MQLRAPRGTTDILPGQVERWQWLQQEAHTIFTRYGYRQIITPTFEHTELFVRGIGETTDVVNKEMYTFTDKGGRSITLRPEGTAPVVRAYLEHNMAAWPQPVKLYYISSGFRYERPQAGRYRQFYQLGAEALGSADPALDAEMIAIPIEIYRRLGLGNFLVKLNSIGCSQCRSIYRAALQSYLAPTLAQLCTTCRSRYEKNPLRILDCKSPQCQQAVENAPHSIDYLCAECQEHFAQVQKYLNAMAIPFELDDRLVRGLDYYSRTVFEVQSQDLGAQSSLCGGGRYDGLVEECGGAPTPGVGFASGVERVMEALARQENKTPVYGGVQVFVISLGSETRMPAFKLVHELRQAGLSVETDYLQRSLKAQMKAADRLGASMVVIVGQDELARGVVQVRNMQAATQEELPIPQVSGILISQLGN